MTAPSAAPGPDELPIDVELIKVLSSDTRRDILRLLGERRKTLTELSEALGLKKATVLEHLQKLVAAGLIRRMDEDQRLWVYYELSHRGKRLVNPGRTRFYLIMGGTAAAALIVGALVAAAMLANVGPQSSSSDEAATPSDTLLVADKAADGVSMPSVAWRGLDESVSFGLAKSTADSDLAFKADDGDTRVIDLQDGRATLNASDLDALEPGRYRLALSSAAGEADLGAVFLVQDPTLALFPLAILDGTPTAVELALAPPGEPTPAITTLRVRGELAPTPLVVTGEGNSTHVAVGRLPPVELRVLPAFTLALAHDNGTLHLAAGDRGVPLANASISLDGASLGMTNATGELLAPWPEDGAHALRIVAADGRAVERGIVVRETLAQEMPPELRIEAFDARATGAPGLRVRADVFNDGVAEQVVTVAARQHGALLASALVTVPAHGRAEVLLTNALARPDVVDVLAHGARASTLGTHDVAEYDNASAGAGVAADAPAAPMAATPAPTAPAPTTFATRNAVMGVQSASDGSGADARVTLYFATPTPMATSDMRAPSAQPAVPGPGALLVLAAVAVAAMTLRRATKR